jgi:hypothetical protein
VDVDLKEWADRGRKAWMEEKRRDLRVCDDFGADDGAGAEAEGGSESQTGAVLAMGQEQAGDKD